LAIFFLVITILWTLGAYSPWALYRNSSGLKDWFPEFKSFFINNSKMILKNHYFGILNVLYAEEPSIKSKISSINIYISNNDLESLDSKNFLFQLGLIEKRPKIQGTFMTHNKGTLPISINIRGSGNHHHQIWKPSIRIRFKKSGISDGYRNHILIAPEDGIGLRNWLSTELSKTWGMLNYGEHFTRLFINNKYMGVYTRYWRLGESTFINQMKVPGPILRLELTSKRDFLRAKQNWYIPSAWDIKGESENKKYTLLSNLTKLAQDIHLNLKPFRKPQKVADQFNLLNEYIDRNSFAKYLALLSHGSGEHVDDIHNNAFWLDVPSGKLSPILVDINGYGMLNKTNFKTPIIKRTGAFVGAWLRDPRNLALYIDKLNELILTFGTIKETEKLIKNKWNEIYPELAADIYLSKMGNPRDLMAIPNLNQDYEQLVNFIHSRINWIKSELIRDKISIVSIQPGYFEIFIEGLSGFSAKRKDGNLIRLIGSQQNKVEPLLLPSIPLKVRTKDKSPLNKANFALPGVKIIPNDLKTPYAFYKIPGKPNDYNFYHRLNKQKVEFSTSPKFLFNHRKLAGIIPLSFPKQNSKPVVIGPGEVFIKSTKEYGILQNVTIRAGTKIFLDSKVSLIFKGPLNIEGTKLLPVTIRPKDPKKPFGVIAIIGEKTKGSKIHYLDIQGGSVHRRYNLEFTGMFSVHDCPNIEISNSRFGINFIGDDAVHLMRSKTKINNSIFENARSDSMDWDLVDGKISDSIFRNSGNDGLDLSMGTAHISKSLFEKSGDKCISAGEGTKTTIVGSNFYQCNVGIAVKDRSKVELTNNQFAENNIAYNSYRKKWRWERGGEGILQNSYFINSTLADIKGDKFSKVTFIDFIPKNIRIEGKLHFLKKKSN